MDSDYAGGKEVEAMRLKTLWYKLVANTLLERVEKLKEGIERTTQEAEELRNRNNDLRKMASLKDSNVAVQVIRERLASGESPLAMRSSRDIETARRIKHLENEVEKMSALRLALTKEMAYSLFLEDNVEGSGHGEVFNALPVEQRERYFRRVQEKLNLV